MSEGGTWSVRKQEEQAKLQGQLDKWTELRLNPQGWRMGDDEMLIRCEILVLKEIIEDRLEVNMDVFDARLAAIIRKELEELLPTVQQSRAEEIRKAITRGINGGPSI